MAVGAPPLVVIGAEGLWGTFLTLTVIYPMARYVFPGSDCGGTCYEDPMDSIAMIQNNPLLFRLTLGFVLTVTVYNCMVIYVTKYLSAIWHAILDNFRPITIWGLDLALFYAIMPGQGFGEQWLGTASWVQLSGLMVLFVGTGVYNGTFGLFGEQTNEYQPIGENNAKPSEYIKTPASMSSPSLSRSPLIYKPANQQPADKPNRTRSGSGGVSSKRYQSANDV